MNFFRQLEEQKIELEGTKARLRMINSRHSIPASAANSALSPPPLTISSVRCRAASTQTESTTKWPTTPPARHPPLSRHSATTQTEDKMAAIASASSRILPRVIDASPKPKSFNGGGGGGGGNAGFSFSQSEEDGDRPSRIPTPIKPSNHYNNNNNNNNKMASPHTKRELPHLPAPTAVPPATAKTPPLRGAATKVQGTATAALTVDPVDPVTVSTVRPAKASIWASWWRIWAKFEKVNFVVRWSDYVTVKSDWLWRVGSKV